MINSWRKSSDAVKKKTLDEIIEEGLDKLYSANAQAFEEVERAELATLARIEKEEGGDWAPPLLKKKKREACKEKIDKNF